VRWVGEGSELWRVRVDLFVERVRPAKSQIIEIAERLTSALTGNDGDARSGIGIDQGTGTANRPVIGLCFWVRADDVGQAALTADDVARRASASAGAGPDLYDVTVIPRNAVSYLKDAKYPPMPD